MDLVLFLVQSSDSGDLDNFNWPLAFFLVGVTVAFALAVTVPAVGVGRSAVELVLEVMLWSVPSLQPEFQENEPVLPEKAEATAIPPAATSTVPEIGFGDPVPFAAVAKSTIGATWFTPAYVAAA